MDFASVVSMVLVYWSCRSKIKSLHRPSMQSTVTFQSEAIAAANDWRTDASLFRNRSWSFTSDLQPLTNRTKQSDDEMKSPYMNNSANCGSSAANRSIVSFIFSWAKMQRPGINRSVFNCLFCTMNSVHLSPCREYPFKIKCSRLSNESGTRACENNYKSHFTLINIPQQITIRLHYNYRTSSQSRDMHRQMVYELKIDHIALVVGKTVILALRFQDFELRQQFADENQQLDTHLLTKTQWVYLLQVWHLQQHLSNVLEHLIVDHLIISIGFFGHFYCGIANKWLELSKFGMGWFDKVCFQ